jgi:hypothetical protein
VLVLTACASVGPSTIGHDQADYAVATDTAAKRQALLNIVKLRYGDVPTFVNVTQIVAGYTVERRIDLGADFFRSDFDLSDDVRFGAGGTFSNRPTITYSPVRGHAFTEFVLTPIPPPDLFALMLSGAPPDLVLALGVHSLNDMRNRSGGVRAGDAGFHETIGLLTGLARDGLLRIRVEGGERSRAAFVELLDGPGAPRDPRMSRLVGLLGLEPGRGSYRITFGLGHRSGTEIAVFTRSIIEMLGDLAARIEVPEGDLRAGRAAAGLSTPVIDDPLAGFRMQHGLLPPHDPHVVVRYDGSWFWLASDDLASKQIFMIVMLLLNLADTDGRTDQPLITIPTG